MSDVQTLDVIEGRSFALAKRGDVQLVHLLCLLHSVGLVVSACGNMAGNAIFTRLLLGMGLRQFSMHPSQILEVKQEILRADSSDAITKVTRLLRQDEPEKIREAVARL